MYKPYDYALPTWYAFADAVGFDGSGNKHFFSLLNGAGSGKILRVHGLWLVNLQLDAVTGVGVRFEVKRIATLTGGSAITAYAADTRDAALPSQVSVATGATVGEGAFLWAFSMLNDEVANASVFPGNMTMMGENLIKRPVDWLQPITLLEQQGITLKQITATGVGQAGVLCVFSNE